MKIQIYILGFVVALLWGAPVFAQSNVGKAIPQTVEELKEMSKPVRSAPLEVIKPLRIPVAKHTIVVDEKTIQVSPGQSKTIVLDRDAFNVIVANPAHATVFLDTPRTLVIMPRAPGATELTVMDAQGNEILRKGIIVSGATADHMRIRRVCGVDDRGREIPCEKETIYYCPDGQCEKIATQEPSFDSPYEEMKPPRAAPAQQNSNEPENVR